MKYYIFTILAAVVFLSACGKEGEKVQSSDELLESSIDSLEKGTNTDKEMSSFLVDTVFNKTWSEYIDIWNTSISDLIRVEPEIKDHLSRMNDIKQAEKIKTSDGISYKVNLTDYTTLIVNTDEKNNKITSIDFASVYNLKDSDFDEKYWESFNMVTNVFNSIDQSIDAEGMLNLIDENYSKDSEDPDVKGGTMYFNEHGILYTLSEGENKEKNGVYKLIARISISGE